MSLKLSSHFGQSAGHDPARAAPAPAGLNAAFDQVAFPGNNTDNLQGPLLTLAQGNRGEWDIRGMLTDPTTGGIFQTSTIEGRKTRDGVRYVADMICSSTNQRVENGFLLEQTAKGMRYDAELPYGSVLSGKFSDVEGMLKAVPITRTVNSELSPIEQFARQQGTASNDVSFSPNGLG